jgi:hypothetical protein
MRTVMRENPAFQSGLFNPRVLVALTFCFVGVPLALLVAPGNARGSLASTPDRTFVTNGPVQAIVRSGDTIYIGGRFDRVGPRTGPGVEVALDGSQNPGLPEISGAGSSSIVGSGGLLSAVAADGSGGWYIGGLFTHVGGIPRTNLAHIRADRSVDPSFNPSVNDAVHTLAVSGSTVYVAGLFTSIGGQTRNNIAALNGADGSVTAFNPNANAGVEALAISSDGSIIYAGGRFTIIGGLPRLSLAALNAADGSATLTFNPSVTGSVGNGVVNALARSGSTLYVGGSFNTIGGAMRNNIAALSLGIPLDGVAVPGFNPSPSYSGCAACGTIAALAVSSDGATAYAGGLFDTIGGKPRNYLAGLNAADGTATPFNPSPNGNIFTLALSSDSSIIYVAGGFNSSNGSPSIGGQARNYAAAVNAIDGTATGFNPNPNAIVNAFGISGSAVYLAGYFSSLGGVVRHSIAAISAIDGTATGFDPNAAGFNGGTAAVYSLAVSDSTVYAGGYFGSIGGQSRASIAALSVADGTATSWDPSGHYFGGPAVVEALGVAADSTVYASGVFTTIGGQTRNNLAALNAADGTATTWDPSPNSEVATLGVSGQLVYVGGYFTTIGGQTRNKIAALNAADGTATSWDPDATASANVLALAISGSTIYAGGNFPSIHGVPRQNIAGINATDGTPTSFDPQASDPSTGGGVYALAVSGSTVYAAGFFTSIGGQTRNLIAGLKASDGTATSFDPNGAPGFGAFALAVASDGTLYAGGSFDTFDLAYQQGFAQFSPILKLVSAVSRKTHGSAGPFDIDLPQTGTPGIECRTGGTSGDHQIIFTFPSPIASVSSVSTTPGSGATGSVLGPPVISGNQVTVNLTNVSNAQTLMINLTGVSDGTETLNVSVPMGVLLGDVNATRGVDGNDVSAVQAHTRQNASATSFRFDVNATGGIDGNDVSAVQGATRTSLP